MSRPHLDKVTQRLLSGKTPVFACTEDPRFSFSLYIPSAHSFDGPRIPLLVAVHGLKRNTGGYINNLKDFSERHGIAVLCPLFPAGIIEPSDVHNYKDVLYRGIRYDRVLLAMLTQAHGVWRIETARFFLHGFSAGGQFAHRFLYLHAHRLRGISIGSPGSITRPSARDAAWPAGLGDVEEVFGVAPDWEAIAGVPMQVLVGERDTETEGIARDDRAGRTRFERAHVLHAEFARCGVRACEITIVRGVGHDGIKCLSAVEAWLAPLL
ncbi:poly hydrolase [Mycena pura]|uniref:Poly hydrolase n=1 Tax=Mycena pura TaxID=153505 RepID=A0AAD7E641_9AGAR|nr:poly hydrolase [Mycena pura]